MAASVVARTPSAHNNGRRGSLSKPPDAAIDLTKLLPSDKLWKGEVIINLLVNRSVFIHSEFEL
jgi:hypothetical protein